MTNKQIEHAEKSLKWVVNQIPEDLGDSNEEKMLKCIRLYCENGVEVITSLKAENAKLQKWKRRQQICNETNTERIMQLEDEKEQIRKETAKEILQALFDEKEFIQDAGSYPVVEARHIIGTADKYGVKIEG